MASVDFYKLLESLSSEYGSKCLEYNELAKKYKTLQEKYVSDVKDLADLSEKTQSECCALKQEYAAIQNELQNLKNSVSNNSAVDTLRKENEALTLALAEARNKNKQLYKVYSTYKSENERLRKQLNHSKYDSRSTFSVFDLIQSML